MLSCCLLRARSRSNKKKVAHDPIVANKIDLSVHSFAQVGCGGAICSYSIDEDEECLVFCVSSLLAHRESTRQHLKVTKCQDKLTDANGMQLCRSLSLTELSCIKDNKDPLPSLASIKESFAMTLTKHAGAISSEDLFLHIGYVKAGTTLEIWFEFLYKFTLPASQDTLQYVFTNRLPTHHLCYSTTLAAPLPIVDVNPFHSASNLDNFHWNYLPHSGSCVVKVVYECRQYSEETTGFTVQLEKSSSPSGCCSICLPQDVPKSGSIKTGFNLPCDGLMMVNISLTNDLLSASVKSRQLHPSEFIFMIDCSGSMAGSSIQAASDTLVTCIKSLPFGSCFNVIGFGSKFIHIFNSSLDYTKWSAEKGVDFAITLQASLGGTDLLDPLRWIFKQERCGNLAKQIFIVTDGGVSNTQYLLNKVRKNKHQARCHTFGIGPEVCTELVTGIATASGGRCVLLMETDRLQTKVMEVLCESLEPYLMDSSLHWSPPEGFSLLETIPKSLGTIHSGSTHTAFALLKREEPPRPAGVLNGSVAVTGQSGDEQVTVTIHSTPLPTLTPSQSLEMASILSKVATWSKLQDMEVALAATSRKNSENEADKTQEAQPKRVQLNCTVLNGRMVDSELCNELVELSISSGVPCILTCFRSDDSNQQLLPPKQPVSHQPKITLECSAIGAERKEKMLRRNRMYEKNKKPPAPATGAAKILTGLGTTIRNIGCAIGLVSPENPTVVGDSIDDHLHYQTLKKTQLHVQSHGKIAYPSSYRNTESGTEIASDDEEHEETYIDPDWDDLQQPSELRPLIQMQLYSGAWPMNRPFSYAVGVPLEEVRKLIEKYPTTVSHSEDDEHSNVWTTSLAICCLEEYFPELRTEWGVLSLKARRWVESEHQKGGPTLEELKSISRGLVTKWR